MASVEKQRKLKSALRVSAGGLPKSKQKRVSWSDAMMGQSNCVPREVSGEPQKASTAGVNILRKSRTQSWADLCSDESDGA